MAEREIETRTPEQMYQQAYDRITFLGNLHIKSRGWRHEYQGGPYRFDFDKGQDYWFDYHSADKFYYYFTRMSDRATLVMTKFSQPPIKDALAEG